MNTYNYREFAKKLGVTPQTVRAWVKAGKLSQPYRSPSGRPFFIDLHLKEFYEKAANNQW